MAASPLLETKLYVPKRRPVLVPRPRLIERLDQGAESKLTLVCAPAGFGKTTLLAEWLGDAEAGGQAPAWVSLDPGDNNPAIFWTYVITALRAGRPGLGELALSMLRSPQPPSIEWILTGLINEISALPGRLLVILDDYHLIDAEPVHGALAFLLDHLPPQLHLVIATRSDPPLPLARLRARGELTELRASDLRFTRDEAAAFLNQAMGLGLSAAAVSSLETRTEGWVVGLQLAAVSMRGREDVPGFVQAFAGDDRYVVDYLVDEVLRSQPHHVRSFLLQTWMLNRLSGPLCDAVTGRNDGTELLEALERDNLFVVPLDDKRHWFRYHRLFADVLQAHAIQEEPDHLPVLHQRASEWYERNGLPSEAVRHALAARDFERAAGLLESAGRAMLVSRREEFLGWLKALPDRLLRVRPVLGVFYALALLPVDLEDAEARLRGAERLIVTAAPASEQPPPVSAEMVIVDREAFRSLPGTIEVVRAYLAGAHGDARAIVRHAQRALGLLPENDHLWRGAAGVLLGLARWTDGQLEEAYRAFSAGLGSLRKTGDIAHEISGPFILGNIRRAQGRLHEAARLYEQPLQGVADKGGPVHPQAADLYVGLSELRYERGDLDAALRYLRRSKELGQPGGLPENRYRWYVAMARIEEAQGRLDRALDLLDEAERAYVRSPDPYVRPVDAVRARVWLREGKLADAIGWARERGLSAGDDLSYLREFEHVTLARVLIARYETGRTGSAIRDATALLKRLRAAAEEGGRLGSLIEVLALEALAHEKQGDISQALVPLERALALAEPEGYIRIFLDEGEAMRTLLRYAATRGIASTYAPGLLSGFSAADKLPAQRAPGPGDGLAELLTPREVEVLRLIAAGMRNQQIADHLLISLPTVKRHIANAYGKLGASHRIEAVARANELNLL